MGIAFLGIGFVAVVVVAFAVAFLWGVLGAAWARACVEIVAFIPLSSVVFAAAAVAVALLMFVLIVLVASHAPVLRSLAAIVLFVCHCFVMINKMLHV